MSDTKRPEVPRKKWHQLKGLLEMNEGRDLSNAEVIGHALKHSQENLADQEIE